MSKFFQQAFSISLFSTFIIVGCTNPTINKPISKKEALYSFAKLYGYIKHFHPSDEAQEIDWDLFAMYGVDEMMKVSTHEELISKLKQLFFPLAPTLEISSESIQGFNYTIPNSFKHNNLDTVFWKHLGYGNGAFNTNYRSARTNRNSKISYILESSDNRLIIDNINSYYDSIKLEVEYEVDTINWNTSLDIHFDTFNTKAKKNSSNHEKSDLLSQSFELVSIVNDSIRGIQINFNLNHYGAILFKNILIQGYKNEENTIIYREGFENYDNSIQNGNSNYSLELVESSQNEKALLLKSIGSKGDEKSLFDEKLEIGDYFTASLGKEIHISFPLVLLSDSLGTIPRAPANELHSLKEKMFMFGRSLDQSGTSFKLGSIVNVWNVFKHFYPYFDEIEADWDSTLRLLTVDILENELETTYYLRRLMHELKDGHGLIRNPKSQDVPRTNFLPLVLENIGENILISKVSNDSLSHLLGGIVKSINHVNIDTILSQNAKVQTASNKVNLYKDALSFIIARESKDTLELNIKLLNGENTDLTIVSNLTPKQFLSFYLKQPELGAFTEISNEIVYIDLSRIKIENFQSNLDKILESKTIIIDNRGNTKSSASEILRYFISWKDTAEWIHIPKILRPDNKEPKLFANQGWGVKPAAETYQGNVLYLTDRNSISYGESIGAYFEIMPNAKIIGEPTAGTNGSVNGTYLIGGYQLRWTGMKVTKHDGSQLHGIGITPDVYVERTPEGIAAGRDEVLEKAIELATKHIETSND